MSYRLGKTYKWQSLEGKFSHLNGQETRVTGPMVIRGPNQDMTWLTDTPHPYSQGVDGWLVAYPGELEEV